MIIPAYNETERLGRTVKEVHDFLSIRKFEFQITIVNDGSTDKTFQKILSLMSQMKNISVISYENNKGKGYAVRQGLLQAKYKTCVVLDADNSVSITELDYFFEASESYTIFKNPFIYGDREQVVSQPIHRIILGKIFKVLVWMTTGIYADTQCPFKILNIDKQIIKELTIDGFAYDVELFYVLKKHGINGRSMIVSYINEKGSKVTIKKTIQMGIDLLKIRRKHKK